MSTWSWSSWTPTCVKSSRWISTTSECRICFTRCFAASNICTRLESFIGSVFSTKHASVKHYRLFNHITTAKYKHTMNHLAASAVVETRQHKHAHYQHEHTNTHPIHTFTNRIQVGIFSVQTVAIVDRLECVRVQTN